MSKCLLVWEGRGKRGKSAIFWRSKSLSCKNNADFWHRIPSCHTCINKEKNCFGRWVRQNESHYPLLVRREQMVSAQFQVCGRLSHETHIRRERLRISVGWHKTEGAGKQRCSFCWHSIFSALWDRKPEGVGGGDTWFPFTWCCPLQWSWYSDGIQFNLLCWERTARGSPSWQRDPRLGRASVFLPNLQTDLSR